MWLHLKRPRKEETSAGGVVDAEPQVLPVQLFRFTPFKRRLTNETWLSNSGEKTRKADWVLHGAHDADVRVKDYFEFRGHEYEVIWVSDHDLYRTAAGVVNRTKIGAT